MTQPELWNRHSMTDEEQALAVDVYGAIQRASNFSERSQQAGNFLMGVSDLGTCSERTRRLLAGIPEADPSDKLAAFVGTAVGDHVEQAYLALYPDAKIQQEVEVELVGDGGTYILTGHPDIIHDDIVIDVKTVDELETTIRTGPTRQQLFQRHLYALGAWKAGLLNCPQENVRTANVWIDRSGVTKEAFAHVDTLSMEIVYEAALWLDEVVYAYKQGQVAQKEPPRNWCQAACGHFSDCRMFDTDVEGLILDDEIRAAVAAYNEGSALAKTGNKLKEDAKKRLVGVNGYVPEGYQIRQNWINPTTYTTERKGSWRMSIVKTKD